ncbi:MAG: sigma 54-interacting transcriptional regulator [Deltaproteobacteria bacterium]|nr:sigma 54-interacting transcriptional regulator [Deltaproteobacteria bacterium]
MQEKNRNVFDPDFANLLLESMADGVFTLDDKGKITSWNISMEHITGYTAEEATGKSCMLLNFTRCFSKSCPTGINECGIYTRGSVDSGECFLRHKEGYDIPVVKNARLVRDEDNLVRGVVETVTDLTELKKARRKAEEANRRLGEIHKFDNIIGKSHAMQQVFSAIKAAAASEATVLLQGESGTGKELVAGAIHYNSDRYNMPFVTVSCSALSESLLESELFGHVKGAFTGAVRDRAGRFEEADGGTIFLDEIGEIRPFIQVKLLRVLQEREIERVGESKKRKIDIRIIAATNKDLYGLVNNGDFREDLYYRLKVFPINMPPLRTRKEDIPILISHFIDILNVKTGKQIKGVSQSTMRILMDYTWPGNVRELENAIEHAFVLCIDKDIDIFDLPVEIRQFEYRPVALKAPLSAQNSRSLGKKLSRDILVEILHECEWNKAEVGRRVGLSRTAIWKYMKKWDIPLKGPA